MDHTREDAEELDEGIGALRWEDDVGTVLQTFGAAAVRKPARDYVHPDTGRPVRVGERVFLDPFGELGPGIDLLADVGFDADGKIEEITLRPKGSAEDDGSQQRLRERLLEWFDAVGLERPDLANDEEQHWDADGIEVELVFEPHTFELTLTRALD